MSESSRECPGQGVAAAEVAASVAHGAQAQSTHAEMQIGPLSFHDLPALLAGVLAGEGVAMASDVAVLETLVQVVEDRVSKAVGKVELSSAAICGASLAARGADGWRRIHHTLDGDAPTT